MKKFLTTTFSPAMLMSGREALVEEITLGDARESLGSACPVCGAKDRRAEGPNFARHCCAPFAPDWTSAVGHEVTAGILTALLGFRVPFARVNLALDHGDALICVIPNFRATEAREFSREEVEAAGFRCFLVSIEDAR